MTMIVRPIIMFLVLGVAVLAAGCASNSSACESKEPRTDEHESHSNQEHYDRGGAVAPKP